MVNLAAAGSAFTQNFSVDVHDDLVLEGGIESSDQHGACQGR